MKQLILIAIKVKIILTKLLKIALPEKLFESLRYHMYPIPIAILRRFALLSSYKKVSSKDFLSDRYKYKFKRDLNLNNPKRFTEKIQWLKINYKNPLLNVCTDKYRVKEYVRKKIGNEYIIPLLYVTDNPKTIAFDKLPSEYIIKPNQCSGYYIIVKNNQMLIAPISKTPRKLNRNKIISTCKEWLKINYYYQGREWGYKNISPKIIIEELLRDDKRDNILNDYKLHCFGGKVELIQTVFSKLTEHKEDWYDLDWNLLDFYIISPHKKRLPRPKNLNKMINIAQELSKDFPYVRIDLYSIGDKIYFGEFTFSSNGGMMDFRPNKWDLILGDKLILPKG